jgi:hypothetical protein
VIQSRIVEPRRPVNLSSHRAAHAIESDPPNPGQPAQTSCSFPITGTRGARVTSSSIWVVATSAPSQRV